MRRIQITEWTHNMVTSLMSHPALCIDATAGTGRDTEFLCDLCGEKGKVIGMDILPEAIEMTRERLMSRDILNRAALVLDSHENMDRYAKEETVDLIMFNLGYLPGGDHTLSTKAETTIKAIEKGLRLLKRDGIMSLMIYSGGDSGFEEKEQVLAYVKALSAKDYTVIVEAFYNKPNHPPIPVLILKH